MYDDVYSAKQREVCGVKDIEEVFQLCLAASPAVEHERDERENAEYLNSARSDGYGEKPRAEAQQHGSAVVNALRKFGSRAERAHIEQADGDGKHDSRNAVVYARSRKAA